MGLLLFQEQTRRLGDSEARRLGGSGVRGLGGLGARGAAADSVALQAPGSVRLTAPLVGVSHLNEGTSQSRAAGDPLQRPRLPECGFPSSEQPLNERRL